jgi:hypothetical protein
MASRGTLDVDTLVKEACNRAGLEDLGPDTWQEGLHALIDSLNTEAALTQHGEELMRQRIVEQLIERLKFERSYRDHPAIAEEQIVQPLIGVGLGRTGSNALGFVLAQDPARRVLRMWEALSPSPPPTKATEHSDPRIQGAQTWIEGMWREFPDYKEMVPLEAEGPTECVYLLAFDFRSQLFESWGRVPSYSEWLFRCDMQPAYEYHRRILKMLQWDCGPRDWFIRSPPHMHAMRELDRVYPDARFVMTHRNVDSMIPSEAALFSSLLTSLTTEPDLHYLGQHLADVRVECMRRLIAFRDDGNEHRFHDIGFNDMKNDPMGQIRRLYAWLEEDLSAAAAERMEAWWDANSRERQGARHYAPETYGVSAEDLRRRFAFYHDRFPALTRAQAR